MTLGVLWLQRHQPRGAAAEPTSRTLLSRRRIALQQPGGGEDEASLSEILASNADVEGAPRLVRPQPYHALTVAVAGQPDAVRKDVLWPEIDVTDAGRLQVIVDPLRQRMVGDHGHIDCLVHSISQVRHDPDVARS